MSGIIKLNDLLNLTKEELDNTKIRLILSKETDHHQLYIDDPEDVTHGGGFLWKQEKQANPFREGHIGLGLLEIGKDRWLFITAQKILKNRGLTKGINYDTEVIDKFEIYFGRVVVRYHNTSQNMCRKGSLIDELEVIEVLSTPYDGQAFPGYENVILSWWELNSIIRNQKREWVAALSNRKGVYLITDTKTGKHYVGSAYADGNMLLHRWTNYIDTGHGGNEKLVALHKKEGFDYIKEHFQYSILENFNQGTDDSVIIQREQWWKDALKSLEHGYNGN